MEISCDEDIAGRVSRGRAASIRTRSSCLLHYRYLHETPRTIELRKEDIKVSNTREGTPEDIATSSLEKSRNQDIAGRVSRSGGGIITTRSSCLLDPERIASRVKLRKEDISDSTPPNDTRDTREGTSEDIGTSSLEISCDEDITRRVSRSGNGSIKTRSSRLSGPERIASRVKLRDEDISKSATREGTSEDTSTSSLKRPCDQNIARRVSRSRAASITTRSS